MAHEALDQGALLTAEDLAYRIFNCGLRTISRDLKMLAGPLVPDRLGKLMKPPDPGVPVFVWSL
ncbi:MAG: hypothetical protein IH820_16505 [Bacteroidetes bacterium]|nr:hypothetical protein [Bacteroidota bacterium]